MSFENFELNENLLRVVKEKGFIEPTEIQKKTIPILLGDEVDFVGRAQTGTGKTAAFVLPLLQKLDPSKQHIEALILTPTRELANQVYEDIVTFSKYIDINSVAVYGGASYDKQIGNIRKKRPSIIVGTPGRIMDLMEKGILKFESTKYVVLDEADEMLNMGFFEDVQKILSTINQEKRLWMFSATMPRPILKLINDQFKNPHVVEIENNSVSNTDIEHRYYVIRQRYKQEALCRILDFESDMYGIVFCRTRMDTRELADSLMTKGYPIETLHGEMGQHQRDAAMAKFKCKKTRLLICTDVAARGIDVNNLSHVINFGIPQDLESYVHRTGRTGRAGMKGVAITLADPKEMYQVRRIESYIKKRIERCFLPTVESLKNSLVTSRLESMTSIKNVVVEKGEDFKLDDAYKIFQEYFEGLDKQELLKIMFTWNFNRELIRFDEIGDLDEKITPARYKGSSSGSSSSSRSRNEPGKASNAPEVGNVRLFLNMGRKDGLRLSTLLKDLTKNTQVKQRQIQNVILKDKFSFLDVPTRHGEVILNNKNLKINNRRVRLEYAQ